MTTVVFVHGTGVRKDAYEESLGRVGLECQKLHDVSVTPCYWGHLGSDLHAQGASVPDYDTTKALSDPSPATIPDEEYRIALWGALFDDPLYELRVLALRHDAPRGWTPGQLRPGQQLAQLGKHFQVTDQLASLLREGGIGAEFPAARLAVTSSESYRVALDEAPAALAEYREAIARAVIAEAVARVVRRPDAFLPPIACDAHLRDAIEQAMVAGLGGAEYGLTGWVKARVGATVIRMASRQVRRHRGAVTDAGFAAMGDILLYQARGDAIRAFIRDRIAEVPSPRVVVAHSLGGIACVDLFAANPMELQLLVTVGSQAPFLYEIGALSSLQYGEPLPPQFPKWLNIYDLQDLLSYIGAKVFEGRVSDVKVNSRQPFPEAHSAYWTNPEVWGAIAKALA